MARTWVLHLKGKNTAVGNPVRCYLELRPDGTAIAYDEGYVGLPEHLRQHGVDIVIEATNSGVRRIVREFGGGMLYVNRNPPGRSAGKFSNPVIEAVYHAMNAGAVTVEEEWNNPEWGDWMALVSTDIETLYDHGDTDELERLLPNRRRFPVLRDGRVIAEISGDTQGFVSGELLDSYEEGRDRFRRAMREMEIDDEDED